MKAVVLHQYGGVDSFKFSDSHPIPAVKDSFVKVKVAYASFNPVDYKIRNGNFGGELPRIIGADFSGVIEEIGSKVTTVKVGDEVYGWALGVDNIEGGSYAEYVVLSQFNVAKKPKNITFAEAASLPVVAHTALEIVNKTRLSKNHSILITAAAGGVGLVLVQMAKHIGAKIVVTAGSEHSEQVLASLGVPNDRIISYKGLSPDQLTKSVIDANGGKFDITVDLYGDYLKSVCIAALDIGGQMATIVEEAPGHKLALFPAESPANLFGLNGTLHTVFIGAASFSTQDKWHLVQEAFNELTKWFENGYIQVPPYELIGNLSVETIVKAHKAVEGHHINKKLVMQVSN